MNKRLFNDNGGETLTPEGNIWSVDVAAALHPLMTKAVADGISLRDLTAVVMDEIVLLTAENLIRKGIEEYKKNRKAIGEVIKSD